MDLNINVTERAYPQTVVRTASHQNLQNLSVGVNEKLVIKSCGQTMQMEPGYARSLMDLQRALQLELQMEAQTFCFFDVNGSTLTTDAQLHDTMAKGLTPICATLKDSSIHYIENRREELAQLQWKLVRDQMTVVNGKMSAIARQANDTQGQLDLFKVEVTGIMERVHKETMWPVETLEKQLEGLRDTLESERSSRRQELAMQMSVIQDIKAQLDSEKTAREQFKEKHTFDIRTIVEKGEAFQKQMTEMLRDQHMAVAKTVEGLHNHFLGNVRQVNQIRTDLDTSTQELNLRFSRMEEGCGLLENRINEMSNRQRTGLESLAERHERVAQVVEGLRLEEKQTKSHLQTCLTRMQDIEASIQETDRMTREMVVQERAGLDDQLQRAQRVTHADYKRQLCELEEKIADRFHRESCERERNVQAIFEEVGSKPANSKMDLMRSVSMPSKTANTKAQAIADGTLAPIVNTVRQVAVSPSPRPRATSPHPTSPLQSFVPPVPQLAIPPQALPPGPPQTLQSGPPQYPLQMTPRAKAASPVAVSPPSSARNTMVKVMTPGGVSPRGVSPQVIASPRMATKQF